MKVAWPSATPYAATVGYVTILLDWNQGYNNALYLIYERRERRVSPETSSDRGCGTRQGIATDM